MIFKKIYPKKLPLSKYEYPVTENGDIDEGLTEYIFTIIPAKKKFCIEFGAKSFEFLHSRSLILNHDFQALLIEADPDGVKNLREKLSGYSKVAIVEDFVDRDNIEQIFKNNAVPQNPDLLIIDIDGNDYHLWEAIKQYHPTFVVIEYNPSYPPKQKFTIDYRSNFVWKGDDYYGASIQSLVDLANRKGYELLHVKMGGDSLYFVKDDEFKKFGIDCNDVNYMYQPPQYGKFGRAANGKGHPASKLNTSFFERIGYIINYYLMAIPRKFVKRKMRKKIQRNKTMAEKNKRDNKIAPST
ncbi:MAG TPA: hypothetical protein ACFCUD_00780 [Cyclobacteriaceae bacterium]